MQALSLELLQLTPWCIHDLARSFRLNCGAELVFLRPSPRPSPYLPRWAVHSLWCSLRSADRVV